MKRLFLYFVTLSIFGVQVASAQLLDRPLTKLSYNLGVDTTFPNYFPAPTPTPNPVPTLPPIAPMQPSQNEFWARPVPIPQTPGVVGGGRIGNTEINGGVFHTPGGVQGGVTVTYPKYPETTINEQKK
ncbi:hypothetical protein V5F53_20720 [Xanthobacter sp. V4C-4]|uniref:hypothetical protein n=1 Tax=Xanthobacter cornucopiae TaxID=3119924 RepID=UPI00372C0680